MSAISTNAGGPASGGAAFSFPVHWTPIAATAIGLSVAALLALPLVSLIRIAAIGDAEIWPHLAAYVIPNASVQTALLLAGVAMVTTIAGAGSAWLVTTFRFRGRDTLLWLLPLPLALPTYIAAYVYVDVLDAAGPVQGALRAFVGWRAADEYWFPQVRSLGGAILIIGFVLYPYVYLAARAMFQTQCAVFIDAARVAGATPARAMRDISLPLARPALAVGVALALMETLNDIGATQYLGVQTLTLSVFNTWLNRGSLPGAAQISLAMLAFVAALIALERYGRRKQRYQAAVQDSRVTAPVVLIGVRGWWALIACLVPVAFGFLIPAGFLAREALARTLATGFDRALLQHSFTTLFLAVGATIVIVFLGFTVTLALRLVRRPLLAGCVTFATLGYAIPGTVLALGLLGPLVGVDEVINWISLRTTGISVGLIVAGSSAAVIIGYTIRFLAISIGFSRAGLARVPQELDDVARSCGAGPLKLVTSIHLPLIRPAIWGCALLVFADCLKELPLTLLLRPLNTETLSTYVYQFAARGSFEEGASAALLIVIVGILPIIRMVQLADGTPGATEEVR